MRIQIKRHVGGWGLFVSGQLEEWYIDWREAVNASRTFWSRHANRIETLFALRQDAFRNSRIA
jgi:hypothetical protein